MKNKIRQLNDSSMAGNVHHVPVLLNETINLLLENHSEHKSEIYVDGTFGAGGYTKKILDSSANDIKVIAIDRDEEVKIYARDVIESYAERLILGIGNFADLKSILMQNKVSSVSGIVLDLGLSSYQLEHESGFSYQRDTELDMRADKNQKLKAKDILNEYDEKELRELFGKLGELRYNRQIARDIVSERTETKFNTTEQLVNLLKRKIPPRYLYSDLSKVFQALRIEVNNELENLKSVLEQSAEVLETSGRMVIVSYHSLEDRIVKNFLRSNESLKLLTKKPITPTEEEINLNVRARSAKLRAAEKIN